MLKLLAPAGSLEAVKAAVQNGADAVYLGLEGFNARRGAKNFTEDTLAEAVRTCHVRGVEVYVTLNTLATDRELVKVELLAKTASRAGADALIVQDLGVAQMVRQTLPDMQIHASTQMSIHNLDGVRRAEALGINRVILARELAISHMAYIAKHTDMELEAFVHGALCMSHSGQCYMSAALGGRSGNRGVCAQPCRLEYSIDTNPGYHLSLKDYCLVEHLKLLETAGIHTIKIEGRMKRPEYVGVVTKIYRQSLDTGQPPTAEQLEQLAAVFSREGFTDSYLKGEKGRHMIGVRTEADKRATRQLLNAKDAYSKKELQRVPVKVYALIRRGETAKVAVSDEQGNIAKVEGLRPETALRQGITQMGVRLQLEKTGGTPYLVQDAEVIVDEGIALPVAELNRLRRAALEELTSLRAQVPTRTEGLFRQGEPAPQRGLPPQLNVSLLKANQLTEEFADLRPMLIYLPLPELLDNARTLQPFLERDELTFSAILPRVILDDEKDRVKRQLETVQEMGIDQCLAGNIGHIGLAQRLGLTVRGDFGLNAFNSPTLTVLKEMGFASATASFELNMAQIRDMDKPLDVELLAYGRLPLMVTENCIMKNVHRQSGCDICTEGMTLRDWKGMQFPVVAEAGCRNVVYNSCKLFLADKAQNYMNIGLWGVRLCFTTENQRECKEVLERYLELGTYEPGEFTRGLYYRGVE
ncbi:MAG: U32 family peptidase [Oscillospiraceae bacterium]|nr:U32 family peptidase [Oscillospiraceae bacterium]